ncbi:MAG: type IV pilus twitching motility protein PilT [Bacillota bacterium]
MYPLTIDEILLKLYELKGSDLHIMAGLPPTFRISGDLVPLDSMPPLTAEDIEDFFKAVLSEGDLNIFEQRKDMDFAYQITDGPRFRGNALTNSGTIGMVFRVFPMNIPQFELLGLPQAVKNLINLPRGLVLVTGTTGSGKSTTLASIINVINDTMAKNIVTVEDPIEYVHKSKQSFVRQREIGVDTISYNSALRSVLRQDPDIILIGEMRDRESISIALSAAETGHLVFSTLHTQSAPQTISRIIDAFEPSQKEQVRQQLASTLKAVISQQLIKNHKTGGRSAAVEFMASVPAISNLIREGKEHQLYSIIQTSGNIGMQTMDMALAKLVMQGKITNDQAFEHCVDKSAVVSLVSDENTELKRQINNSSGANISL